MNTATPKRPILAANTTHGDERARPLADAMARKLEWVRTANESVKSKDKLEQNDTKRVHIGPRGHPAFPRQLRRHVAFRAEAVTELALRAFGGLEAEKAGQAEVAQFNRELFAQKDICGLWDAKHQQNTIENSRKKE